MMLAFLFSFFIANASNVTQDQYQKNMDQCRAELKKLCFDDSKLLPYCKKFSETSQDVFQDNLKSIPNCVGKFKGTGLPIGICIGSKEADTGDEKKCLASQNKKPNVPVKASPTSSAAKSKPPEATK